MKLRMIKLTITLACMGLLSVAAFAQDKSGEMKGAVERVDSATKVFKQIMKASDKAIPRELLDRAQAVIVFPGALRIGFIVGGQGGSGLAIRRTANGWSAPAFLNMGGGSFGAQIGGEKTDYVLLVMNEDGLAGLLEDKLEMGGELSVSAGPVGRTAAASTNLTLDAAILTYSRSRGLFAGAVLKGVVITQNESMNQAIYQRSAREILGDSAILWSDAPAALQKFPKTVASYSK
jgi:lipid-binding SYLF domain-containing protein